MTYADEAKIALARRPGGRPRRPRGRVGPGRRRDGRGRAPAPRRRRRRSRSPASPARTAARDAKPVGLTYVAVADADGRRRPAPPVDRRPRRRTSAASAGRGPGAVLERLDGAPDRRVTRDAAAIGAGLAPARPRAPDPAPASASTSSARRARGPAPRRSWRTTPGAIVSGCDAGGPSPYTPRARGRRHRRSPGRTTPAHVTTRARARTAWPSRRR